MWFTPTRPLETTVVCGQLCGENHGNMVGRLEVIESEDYDNWARTRSEDALKRRQAPSVAAR
jgi:cytochrome c oxidase subunit 2